MKSTWCVITGLSLVLAGCSAQGTRDDGILNFHIVDTSAAGAPIILRGGRLGINPRDPQEVNKLLLARDMQTLKHYGVNTLIDLQGGDIHANVRIKNSQGTENKILSDAVNKTIDEVNKSLEPGETEQHWQAERDAATALNIRFEHHALNSLEPITELEKPDIIRILQIMHDPARQPVYVHCEHGHDRTGMIIALYQVCFDGKNPESAYQEMIAMGHDQNDHVTQSTDIFFWQSVATGFCNTVRK